MTASDKPQKREDRGDSTQAVHAGASRFKAFHSLTTPIVQSASYTFRNTAELLHFLDKKVHGGELDREEYARYGNPSVWALESRIAALEGADAALMFPSGMAAATSLFLTVLRPGTQIIMTDDCYRRTRQFCQSTLKKFGVETSIVPIGDYEAMEAAIQPEKTRIIFTESPSNPTLRVVDLPRLASLAQRYGVLTLLDTTFATPVNVKPLAHGIDFVMHSATKYLGGHNDVLGGVIAGQAGRIHALVQARGILGNVIDPHQAYLLERGLKTLALRLRQQNATALQVAHFLEAHPKVEYVYYPGLPSHPDYAIAQAQMAGGGGVVSFELAGDLRATSDFIDRLRIPYIAPSLGGTESLIEQPAYFSYYDLSSDERQAIGIKDNLVRFAIGIEDAADILDDLQQSLAKVP